MQDHLVPEQATTGRLLGLVVPDGGKRLHEHALELRDGGDPSRVVENDGEVPNLREREQALVAGVLPCDRVEQIDVLHRGETGDVELREPPEVVPLPEHGMQVAEAELL